MLPVAVITNSKFFLGLLIFALGYIIGISNRTSLCIHNIDDEKFGSVPLPVSLSNPCPKESQVTDKSFGDCGILDVVDNSNTHLHTNHFRKIKNSVLTTVFGMLHHPSCPVQAEVVVTSSEDWKDDYSTCQSVYAVRSPVRDDHPNKCYAVMRAAGSPRIGKNSSLIANKIKLKSVDSSIPYTSTGICHRTGHIDWPQILTDQYQDDYIRSQSYEEEARTTSLFFRERDQVVSAFLAKVGSPINADGTRRAVVVMIANEGVIDLLLNLLCSAQAAKVELADFVVFSGQEEYCTLIESLGVRAFFHPSLGSMPKEAAVHYADRVFTKMMWLKVTSVYLSLAAGFHVLFQDVDLVWVKNPVPYLIALDKYDIIFMDDGARTPRFAPYFTNTGFYFVRNVPITQQLFHKLILAVGEIEYTASHQATLIRRVTETQAAFGLQILVLDDRMFPSGRMYHEQPQFVEDVKNHVVFPYVWHMCWTANRDQKVTYYKNLGLWFLSDDSVCSNAPLLLRWVHSKRGQGNVFEACCTKGGYWQ